MKKRLPYPLTITLLLTLALSSYAAYTADSATGTWLVPKGDAKVTIYKYGNILCGKISWLKTPDDLDVKNPDPAKRNSKILGMNILWGFTFDGSEWTGGQIYDPDSGSTYKCKMWLNGDDQLNVKGYMGVSLFGRAETWTRVK